jgi:hypothetical protein
MVEPEHIPPLPLQGFTVPFGSIELLSTVTLRWKGKDVALPTSYGASRRVTPPAFFLVPLA